MKKLHIIALIIATLTAATFTVTTEASACPGGYVRCGPGCCPAR